MIEAPSRIETIAFAYLTIPVVVFFLTFTRFLIGIPAALFLLWSLVSLARASHKGAPVRPAMWAYMAAVIAAVMLLGGYGHLFPENYDWIKHYAVTNELATKRWPVIEQGSVLRYSIGWYLLPALALKWIGGQPNYYLSAWAFAGMLIFFRLVNDLSPLKRFAIIFPLVFVAFSGMDALGTFITGYRIGPPFHLEWWAGWGEYPSEITSLFWTPQHALPAWIGLAMIMRQRDNPTMLRSLPALFFAICLWSPFAAIGLAPLALVLLVRFGVMPFISVKSVAAVVLVGVPLAVYLLAGSGSMPHSLSWTGACGLHQTQCFTAPHYLLFIGIEFAIFAIVLFAARSEQRGILIAATVTLLILPLVKFGLLNDLMMRGSIAPLGALAILTANALTVRGWKIVAPLCALLLVGSVTPLGEMARAIVSPMWSIQSSTFTDVTRDEPRTMSQYFAPPMSIIRVRGRGHAITDRITGSR